MVKVVPLSILVLVVGAANAGAVVLCATQRADGTFNTSVKIRQTCRANETHLDPGALGLQGPPGQPGDRGPALVWKDANGVFVALESFGGGSSGVRRLGADLVRLDMSPSGFIQRGT